MFEGWDDFYLLIGGASGGLIGLLFIVVTLIQGNDGGLKLKAAAAYMTPTVAHLAVVLVMCATATAPHLTPPIAGGLFLGGALVCLGFSGRALYMLAGGGINAAHWSDVWGYGVAPFIAAAALAVAAAAAWIAPGWAILGIAVSLVAMLLIAVRNAWDLVTWISAGGGSPSADG
ncbi:hypothetical protein [Phenylobacterium sp.]|uniref:hypothetical protein n=1 Tax=Phenylobacterium sp. TaxID=1871053 RepID=UPI002F4036E3